MPEMIVKYTDNVTIIPLLRQKE